MHGALPVNTTDQVDDTYSYYSTVSSCLPRYITAEQSITNSRSDEGSEDIFWIRVVIKIQHQNYHTPEQAVRTYAR